MLGPTSFEREEGLRAGRMHEVGSGSERGGGGRRERMNINRDVVDVSFKFRSLSKMAFDMNASKVDNKIKFCIILGVF